MYEREEVGINPLVRRPHVLSTNRLVEVLGEKHHGEYEHKTVAHGQSREITVRGRTHCLSRQHQQTQYVS